MFMMPPDDLLIAVDQHAADERRRLEILQAEVASHLSNHPLAPAWTVRLTARELDVARLYQDTLLNTWGFEFTCDESTMSLRVTCAPVLCGVPFSAEDLRDYLAALISAPASSKCQPPAVNRVLHSKSCRSAIMFGDELTRQQCTDLLDGLSVCRFPWICAHGRPTLSPVCRFPMGMCNHPRTTSLLAELNNGSISQPPLPSSSSSLSRQSASGSRGTSSNSNTHVSNDPYTKFLCGLK